jgi:hypothetical protein
VKSSLRGSLTKVSTRRTLALAGIHQGSAADPPSGDAERVA